jgi:hypothetical protein
MGCEISTTSNCLRFFTEIAHKFPKHIPKHIVFALFEKSFSSRILAKNRSFYTKKKEHMKRDRNFRRFNNVKSKNNLCFAMARKIQTEGF